MKKRLYSIIVLITLLIGLFMPVGNLSHAAALEGDGTVLSPYLIRTASDLFKIKDDITAHYKLENDLDLEEIQRQPIDKFNGVLDGDGHVIKNMIISGITNVGLFGTLNQATIKNLGFENAVINGTGEYVGVLFGVSRQSATDNINFKDCNVTGSNHVGILGGFLDGAKSITKCHTIGGKVISSSDYAGGLVGTGNNAAFFQCYSYSDIEGATYMGGLAGSVGGSTKINQCFAVTYFKTGRRSCGGLIGYSGGNPVTLENSYATGTITSEVVAAGLIGDFYYGLVINNCYSAAHLTSPSKHGLYGGSSTDTVKNSYFDSVAAGVNLPNYQVRTTDQMYKKSNYVDWDFDNIWSIDEGSDYPKLRFADSTNESGSRLKVIMEIGEKLLLSLSNNINDNTDLKWSSSNNAIVSVNSEGRVTALKKGEAVITCTNEDESYQALINILIVADASEYRLAIDLQPNEERRVTIDTIANAANVLWNSVDPLIAKISAKGKITAVSSGLALIKAVDNEGNELGAIYVRVR